MDAVNETERGIGLARDLTAIVGRENVIEGESARTRYAHDQWWYAVAAAAAGRAISRPEIAVRPTTTEQVSGVMRYASANGIPVTAWGGAAAYRARRTPIRAGSCWTCAV